MLAQMGEPGFDKEIFEVPLVILGIAKHAGSMIGVNDWPRGLEAWLVSRGYIAAAAGGE